MYNEAYFHGGVVLFCSVISRSFIRVARQKMAINDITMPSSLIGAGVPAWFETHENRRLYFETFPRKKRDGPLLNILFAHGVHESADTTTVRKLAEKFQNVGNFCVLEHHGHGRSDGRRGQVESLSRIVSEVSQFVRCVVSRSDVDDSRANTGDGDEVEVPAPNKNLRDDMKSFSFAEIVGTEQKPGDGESDRLQRDPSEHRHADEHVYFAVVGHSMGGCALTFLGDRFASDYGQAFLGCILLAPAIVGPIPDRATCSALNFLSRIVPFLPVGPPEHTEDYDTGSGWDLNYAGRMRLGTAAMFVKLFLEVRDSMEKMTVEDDDRLALASLEDGTHRCTMWTYSWLVLHGDKDSVVPLSNANRIYDFYRRHHDSNLSKEVVVMKGVTHTPFCDDGSEECKKSVNGYIEHAVEWTRARLQVALNRGGPSETAR